MSDKSSEFLRINEPRVRRALEQISHIEKSALSMRVSPQDVQELMQPVFSKTRGCGSSPSKNTAEGDPPAGRFEEATLPVAREMSRLNDMTTQQVVDIMIACGATLAKRRK